MRFTVRADGPSRLACSSASHSDVVQSEEGPDTNNLLLLWIMWMLYKRLLAGTEQEKAEHMREHGSETSTGV